MCKVRNKSPKTIGKENPEKRAIVDFSTILLCSHTLNILVKFQRQRQASNAFKVEANA